MFFYASFDKWIEIFPQSYVYFYFSFIDFLNIFPIAFIGSYISSIPIVLFIDYRFMIFFDWISSYISDLTWLPVTYGFASQLEHILDFIWHESVVYLNVVNLVGIYFINDYSERLVFSLMGLLSIWLYDRIKYYNFSVEPFSLKDYSGISNWKLHPVLAQSSIGFKSLDSFLWYSNFNDYGSYFNSVNKFNVSGVSDGSIDYSLLYDQPLVEELPKEVPLMVYPHFVPFWNHRLLRNDPARMPISWEHTDYDFLKLWNLYYSDFIPSLKSTLEKPELLVWEWRAPFSYFTGTSPTISHSWLDTFILEFNTHDWETSEDEDDMSDEDFLEDHEYWQFAHVSEFRELLVKNFDLNTINYKNLVFYEEHIVNRKTAVELAKESYEFVNTQREYIHLASPFVLMFFNWFSILLVILGGVGSEEEEAWINIFLFTNYNFLGFFADSISRFHFLDGFIDFRFWFDWGWCEIYFYPNISRPNLMDPFDEDEEMFIYFLNVEGDWVMNEKFVSDFTYEIWPGHHEFLYRYDFKSITFCIYCVLKYTFIFFIKCYIGFHFYAKFIARKLIPSFFFKMKIDSRFDLFNLWSYFHKSL